MTPRILISGAGIAGLAHGFWLKQVGLEPVVIDRAPSFQSLGHYIALKGNGVEVVREMGLEAACRAREAKFSQIKFLTADGRLLRLGSPAEFDDKLGFILFRRSDLHDALFTATNGKLEVRYGTELRSVRDTGSQVEVEYSDGAKGSFDLVVGADGIHSRTRQLVFGDGFLVSLDGLYFGLTEDYDHRLERGIIPFYMGSGQTAALYPTSPDRVSAVFYFGGGKGPNGRDATSIKPFLLEKYRGFAPEVNRFLSALDERAFVFSDHIAQVRLPSIVKGRVALVGDAAHCPTFMSGMGASLALQGARLLALSLAEAGGDPLRALPAYEAGIAPIAARYQASALKMRSFLLDHRPWVPIVRNLVLRLTPQWIVDREMRAFFHSETLRAAPHLQAGSA